jgi:hypothetical protein
MNCFARDGDACTRTKSVPLAVVSVKVRRRRRKLRPAHRPDSRRRYLAAPKLAAFPGEVEAPRVEGIDAQAPRAVAQTVSG